MSTVSFLMDLGDAGTFDFTVDYQYYPADTQPFYGEKPSPEHVLVNEIWYGGLDWTKQLKTTLETSDAFIQACRNEWLDEIAEHQLRMAGV